MRLILEEVLDGEVRLIAEVDEHVRRIGRDLTTDIPLASSALSRQHGVFYPFLTGWIYKDLGSTNGSWHNGQKLESNKIVGLKEGDYLQLADVILKVRYRGDAVGDLGTRLLILKGGEPVGEYAFARMGYRLDLGGRSSQMQIGGYTEDLSAVTFEMKSAKVYVDPHELVIPVRLNNVAINGATKLSRGDYLVINEYEVLLVEGTLARAAVETRPTMQPSLPQTDLTAVPTSEKIKEESKPQVFSATHTVAIQPDKQKILKFGEVSHSFDDDAPPATSTQFRSLGGTPQPKSLLDFESMSEIERRLVYGIIFFLGASFFLFATWLIFL